ncbi:MAG: LysR family transcriptional regulator [Phycisphaerae bacterium]
MTYEQLMTFLAVADSGGFSAGAKLQGISQPAVSMQMALLEKSLGLRLMDRQPRGIVLTEAGVTLVQYARRLSELFAQTEHAIADIRDLKQGRLAIGASTTIGAYWLPALLATYRQSHPGVELSVRIANTAEVQQALLDGTLHLGFTEGSAEHPELASKVFWKDQLVPIVPADHPLTKRKRITLEMVANEPLIIREPGSGTRTVLEQAAAKRGVTLKPFLEIASTEAIKALVAAGSGVAVISALAIEDSAATSRFKGVVALNLADGHIERPLHILWAKNRHWSGPVEQFVALLRKTTKFIDA